MGVAGKHLGEYDQIVVTAVKGIHPNPEQLYDDIMRQKADPRPLVPQSEPPYKLPAPRSDPAFCVCAGYD